jgi:hypothetical protein
MSFLGLGHFRHYTDAQWATVKPALEAAGISGSEGAMFTQTQAAIATLLKDDQLVALAEKAISDVAADPTIPLLQRLATAAADVGPGLVTWFATGGVTKELADVTTIATTFVQEVYNIKNSTSIAQAVADVATVAAKVA